MNVPISTAGRQLLPPGLAVLMLGLTAVGTTQTAAAEQSRSAPTTTTIHSAFVELAPLGDSGVVGVVEFTLGPEGMSIVHAGRGDLTSQPAGNAGARVACGVIRAVAKARIAVR